MAGRVDYDAPKLKELILFVARSCEADVTFGSVKLNKILFYSDFEAFRTLGRSITGSRYQHLPEGPGLFPMVPIMREMDAEQIVKEVRGTEGPSHRRAIALRDPDLSAFSGQEIGIVTTFITALWGLPAGTVSDMSHKTMGWRLTKHQQEIPYGMAILSSDELTDEDLEWLYEAAAKHDLLDPSSGPLS